MSSRGEEPRIRGTHLHEKVAHFYYSFGLFCSTYPFSIICFAIFTSLLCCYPLSHLPLVGNVPLQIWGDLPNATAENLKIEQPYCYVQQVVLRIAVMPWEPHLTMKDAFRAPLYESFKLLEIIRNYEDSQSLKTLSHYCLHVESFERNVREDVLPQYSCLVLSPANLWRQDVQQFTKDSSILNTVFSYQNLQKGKTSLAEMLFGMQLKDTGIKRYPMRTRQRVIQYAVTLFFKEYNEGFIHGLQHKLQVIYPLHQNFETNNSNADNSFNRIVHIYYPHDVNYYEFIPLIICLVVLFLYYYFSIRKIEFIKSKIGMAFTAVVTILGSLSMTLGICFFFGLTLSLHGKEILPYLVILVGLENVLVLTKSILATPSNLDAKIRVAKGLSKEGWSITKNLLLEITILTFGLFTFVPSIQELCIFAIVGLISDFFLQMFFFSTILGIDVRRMENLVEKTYPNFANNLLQNQGNYGKNIGATTGGMYRSKSHPRLSSFHNNIKQAQNHEKKIPKRVRLVNIWARTRFFQRAFMILMVVWIVVILHKSELIYKYLFIADDSTDSSPSISEANYSSINISPLLETNSSYAALNYVRQNQDLILNSTDLKKLKHPEYAPWLRLSTKHWQAILRNYNVSLYGNYISILPNIKISYVVRPEQAVLLRNPEEKYNDNFQWQALAMALDPIDFSDLENDDLGSFQKSERPLYPSTPMEIVLTTILCIISVIVLAYTFVVLYRCICTRNYAEWRASWFDKKAEDSSEIIPVLLEVIPVSLDGHEQEVECVASDGFSVASSCLSGHLKVWDAASGVLLVSVERKMQYTSVETLNSNEENFSDYESGSPPSRDELCASFAHYPKMNLNFSHLTLNSSRIKRSNSDTVECSQCYRCKCNSCSDFDFENWVGHDRSNSGDILSGESENNNGKVVPIWCMDFVDNLIAVGCANGQVEFWEGTTGKLKCVFEDGNNVGITSIKIIGSQVIVARLHGTLDFLRLQTYNHGKPIDWNFTCAYRRTHARTSSAGSIMDHRELTQGGYEDLRCLKILSEKAHQQLITCLDSEGGRVLTGSQDHTLRVFRLTDGSSQYTLHGHCGPITCLFIDRVNPATSASGSQDGMLCVWDLMTGACMYSLQAHDGSVHSLTYSASYVISLGSDERLCIWERFQGHLLKTVHLSNSFSCQITMLTPHLLVTARSGALVVWDVRTGDSVRTIPLGQAPLLCVKNLLMLRDAVLCDYGKKLKIVRFPLITHKYD